MPSRRPEPPARRLDVNPAVRSASGTRVSAGPSRLLFSRAHWLSGFPRRSCIASKRLGIRLAARPTHAVSIPSNGHGLERLAARVHAGPILSALRQPHECAPTSGRRASSSAPPTRCPCVRRARRDPADARVARCHSQGASRGRGTRRVLDRRFPRQPVDRSGGRCSRGARVARASAEGRSGPLRLYRAFSLAKLPRSFEPTR